MGDFEQRKQAFENKFKHDEEIRFRVQVRGAKIFGLWAAEQLGIDGDTAQAYALEVVDSDFDEPGIEDILRKVSADLAGKKVEISDHVLRTELDEAMAAARHQIMTETTD